VSNRLAAAFRLAGWRVLGAVIVVWGVVTLTFILARVVSPDPTNLFVNPQSDAATRAAVRHSLGLDQPLWSQYGIFLADLVRGNLATSFVTKQPVAADLGSRLPATLELAVYAVILGTVLGVATGVTAAVERYYVRASSLSGPAPFAAVGDVVAQYGSMTAAEESLAGWLLRAASNMIRARRPVIDQQIADGIVSQEMAALAVTNMVLRVMRNPSGLRSETVGPFSRSYDTTVAAGLLVFTDDEEQLIAPTGTESYAPAIGQIRPRAALAIAPIRRRGGWPDGWW